MKTSLQNKLKVLILFLFLGAGSAMAQQSATLVRKVITGTDDAEEQINGTSSQIGTIDLTSSDLEIMQDGSKDQVVGMRFSFLDIPTGATINRAYIQFTVAGKTPVNGDAYIFVEDNTNAPTFTTTPFDISSRVLGTDSILWSGSTSGTWNTANAAGAEQRTPNFASVLQPLINQASWSSGNPVVIILKGTGVRNARSYNGSASGAAQLIVEYSSPLIPGVTPVVLPIEKKSTWKFLDDGTDQGTAWTTPSFNDNTWSTGPGPLGYGDNQTTTLNFGPSSTNKFITSYLRKEFLVSNLATLGDSLDLSVLRDDGVVIYINGTEVVRDNMPAGPVTYATLASSNVSGSAESTYYNFRISKNVLVSGSNVIAVELHQDAITSSDFSFDLELKEVPFLPVTNYPVAANSSWRYLDNGSDQGTAWTAPAFPDASWAFGPGKLGYSDNPATTLGFGPNSGNKYITYYFRKKIDITNLANLTDTVQFNILRDDGAIVYVNGTEIFRDNMPTGTVDYLTWSSSITDGADESTYFPFLIPKTVFTTGVNTIAVEIHQRDGTSSDMNFDMSVANYTPPPPPPPPIPCDTLAANHISKFTSVQPSAQNQLLRIPSSHTFQMIVQSGDPYTNIADGNTKGLFDFTGYVPIANSSTDGYLSINHELGSFPSAGVSMLKIAYNPTSQLWNVQSNHPVDFAPVFGTGRNCSGAVTPWNTIITAEETLPSTDANSDGYFDTGWLVEIDPVTHSVIDQNNDLTPDKLWQAGRMSHENAVIAFDNKTMYYGNDENPGYLYKFVADTATKLGQGSLFALKLDGAPGVSTTGIWVSIPNSTPTECNNVRAAAASLSATNFANVEDAEISPKDSMVYFTSKSSGRVYRFKDHGSTVTDCSIFVGNSSTQYPINYGTATVNESWGGGNDNLTFDDEGNLYVLQDGGRNHIWMVKPCHTQANPQVELFAVTPAGCEPTGMTFSPDYKFMFLSIMHPSSGNNTAMIDAAGNSETFNKESAIVIARQEFLGSNAPLPISFISFDATSVDNRAAMLNWEFHTTETTNKFEVQRMMLGGEFETIATLTATSRANKESYLDNAPYIGKNIYRIKAVDINDQAIFSKTKVVHIASSENLSIARVYPNPTSEKLNVEIISPSQEVVSIKLINNLGVTVANYQKTIDAGNNNVEVDMKNLAAGIYNILVQSGTDILKAKVVKQ